MKRGDCEVTENRRLADGVFSLTFEAGGMAADASPGMFAHIACGHSRILRRPISIADARDGGLTVVFEVKGDGTRWLSRRVVGDVLDVIAPLGRGFGPLEGNTIAVGGGMGAAPLLFAASRARAGAMTAILGFRDSGRVILEREFKERCARVRVTTEDGSAGERGTVTPPLRELLAGGGFDTVIACGPRPMLAAVHGAAREYGARCLVSLEERMGCGVGACLTCACETVRDGAGHMSRVCRDGPVFDSREVAW